MEQVVADIGSLIVGDLGPQSGAVGFVSEVAPMVTDATTTAGEIRLLGPSVVGDVPAQVPECRQGSGADESGLGCLRRGFGEQDLEPILV